MGKRFIGYEVPWDTMYIAALKPTSSGLKFTVYSLSVEEEVGVVWYRAKHSRWEAWNIRVDVRPVMDALVRTLGTPPKPLNAPDYP